MRTLYSYGKHQINSIGFPRGRPCPVAKIATLQIVNISYLSLLHSCININKVNAATALPFLHKIYMFLTLLLLHDTTHTATTYPFNDQKSN